MSEYVALRTFARKQSRGNFNFVAAMYRISNSPRHCLGQLLEIRDSLHEGDRNGPRQDAKSPEAVGQNPHKGDLPFSSI